MMITDTSMKTTVVMGINIDINETTGWRWTN